MSGSDTQSDGYEPNPHGYDLFPLEGSYVVFSIDPVESLKGLKDPEVDAVTQNMTTKIFVGYIELWENDMDISSPYLAITLLPLAQGLPKLSEELGIEPDMCVPVLPNTYHPLSREPMRPPKPLPWPNCYHHTASKNVTLRVPREYVESSNAWVLPYDQLAQLTKIRRADITRSRSIAKPKFPGVPEISRGVDSNSTLPDGTATPQPDGKSVNVIESDTGAVYLDSIAKGRLSNTLLVARVSYDLTKLDTPADPEEFLKEKAFLEQLEIDARLRAIERAQKIDNEAFPVPPKQKTVDEDLSSPKETRKSLSLRSILGSVFQIFFGRKGSSKATTAQPVAN